jgi:murein DD-endopeptidase MepM/ murein hydrolase activator NlpD
MSTVKQRYAPPLENIPYLTLPLKSDFKISEGYIYSEEERSIHKRYFHKGIDYACPYGTPVYASADGYAVAGYHRFTEINKDKTLKLYQGLPMGNGFGYFIQIYTHMVYVR